MPDEGASGVGRDFYIMKGITITLVLAGVVVGAAGSAIVVTAIQKKNNDDEASQSAKDKLAANQNFKEIAEKRQKIIEDLQKEKSEDKAGIAVRRDNEVRRLQGVINQQKKDLELANNNRVSIGLSPKQILDALPEEYKSNERIPQRRRIYLTEALVDLGEGALPEIQTFLESNVDVEPDIQADRERRVAEKWGIETAQIDQIKSMMEDMKPQLDAEREARREEMEKRRAEGRAEWEKIRAELEGLPEEERRQKMRERFTQMRERGEREREERGSSDAAKEMEGRVQLILSAEQYNAVQEQRGGVQAMLGEVGGRGRGGFGDWGGWGRRGGR